MLSGINKQLRADPFSILGLHINGLRHLSLAQLEELIKLVFLARAKMHHPDAGGNSRVMKRLLWAWEQLGQAQNRDILQQWRQRLLEKRPTASLVALKRQLLEQENLLAQHLAAWEAWFKSLYAPPSRQLLAWQLSDVRLYLFDVLASEIQNMVTTRHITDKHFHIPTFSGNGNHLYLVDVDAEKRLWSIKTNAEFEAQKAPQLMEDWRLLGSIDQNFFSLECVPSWGTYFKEYTLEDLYQLKETGFTFSQFARYLPYIRPCLGKGNIAIAFRIHGPGHLRLLGRLLRPPKFGLSIET